VYIKYGIIKKYPIVPLMYTKQIVGNLHKEVNMQQEISNFSKSLALVLDELDDDIERTLTPEQEFQLAVWLERYYQTLHSETFEDNY
jgi:hypothetical protein